MKMKSELWKSLDNLGKNFPKIFDIAIKDEKVTKVQAAILISIAEEDMNINKMALKLELNQGNLSNLCKKMQEDGYLERVRNKEDERIVNIILSNKGQKVVDRINERFDEIAKELDQFSVEKLKSIINGINDLNDFLEYILNKEGEKEC